MNAEARADHVMRETILRLLSDDEIARVSTVEAAPQLADGDEYIDLLKPDQGVRRARGKSTAPMGEILARKAVHANTWHQIAGLVSASRSDASRSST